MAWDAWSQTSTQLAEGGTIYDNSLGLGSNLIKTSECAVIDLLVISRACRNQTLLTVLLVARFGDFSRTKYHCTVQVNRSRLKTFVMLHLRSDGPTSESGTFLWGVGSEHFPRKNVCDHDLWHWCGGYMWREHDTYSTEPHITVDSHTYSTDVSVS